MLRIPGTVHRTEKIGTALRLAQTNAAHERGGRGRSYSRTKDGAGGGRGWGDVLVFLMGTCSAIDQESSRGWSYGSLTFIGLFICVVSTCRLNWGVYSSELVSIKTGRWAVYRVHKVLGKTDPRVTRKELSFVHK